MTETQEHREMVTRKSGNVTETIPAEWVEQEKYETKKNELLLKRANARAEEKAQKEIEELDKPKQSRISKVVSGVGGFFKSVGKMIPERRERPRSQSNSSPRRSPVRRVQSQTRQPSLGFGRGLQFNPPKFNLGNNKRQGMSLGIKPLRFKTKRFKL